MSEMDTTNEREVSESNAAYLSGADSFVYLAYGDLEMAEQRLCLNQSGPNAVHDVLLQIYRAEEWLSRGKRTFLEIGTSVFQFQTDIVSATKKVDLTIAPELDNDNPRSWNLAIQFLTRAGSYFQILLLDYLDGEWTQGQMVFSIEAMKINFLRMHFDDRFPEDRRVHARNRIADWLQDGGGFEIRRDKLKAQFPWPSLW